MVTVVSRPAVQRPRREHAVSLRVQQTDGSVSPGRLAAWLLLNSMVTMIPCAHSAAALTKGLLFTQPIEAGTRGCQGRLHPHFGNALIITLRRQSRATPPQSLTTTHLGPARYTCTVV
jgi:hypothetical protein